LPVTTNAQQYSTDALKVRVSL